MSLRSNPTLPVLRRTPWRLYPAALVASDILATLAAAALAYLPGAGAGEYALIGIALTTAVLILFALSGLYDGRNLLLGAPGYRLVFRGVSVSLLLLLAAGVLPGELVVARGRLALAWGLLFLCVAAGRFCLRRAILALRAHGYFLRPALILGTNAEARALAQQLGRWTHSGMALRGLVAPDGQACTPSATADEPAVVGTLQELDALIERFGISELIVARSAVDGDTLAMLFRRYGVSPRVTLRQSSGVFDLVATGLRVAAPAHTPLVRVEPGRLTGPDRALKAVLDYALTIPGLIIIAPLLLALAVAVRLDSPGPVIYRRRVLGLNGRQFDALKFRTMVIDGDAVLAAHPELRAALARDEKLKDDPRVTRLGGFLRRYSLDELPQLINVLRYDMSLVGPRMITPGELVRYGQCDMNLLTMRPGITGLWQVSGRSELPYADRVRLDMYYVRNWTFWLDLEILARTPAAVTGGKGAY